jgi:hypothetical protein
MFPFPGAGWEDLRRPPAQGYGDPYQGTGAPIFVKDSRTDWDISEGGQKISSEQALEATGDAAYEARRQQMKRYNAKLYSEGKWHRRWAVLWELVGLGAVGGGVYYAVTAPTSMGSMSNVNAAYEGYGAALAGLLLYYYVRHAAAEEPPYVEWHTPPVYDRPTYVRGKTEPYNEKHGAPSTAEQPGSVENAPGVPGKNLRMR